MYESMYESMYEINIANHQDRLEINEDLLTEVVRTTLEAEQVESAEISVAVVDNEEIHALNRQYLAHDYETDVLSFLLESSPGPESTAPPAPRGRAAGATLSGEIIMSAEMALQLAGEYHWSPQDELVLYLVHGLLHLCGYDDLTPPERELMRARERDVLKHWKLVPHYVESPQGDEPAGGPSVNGRMPEEEA
jgi:probable rRNA maturation factor